MVDTLGAASKRAGRGDDLLCHGVQRVGGVVQVAKAPSVWLARTQQCLRGPAEGGVELCSASARARL